MIAQQIAADAQQLLRDQILLPYIIQMLDKQRAEIEASRYLFKRLYLESTHIMIIRAEMELSQARQHLQRAGIRTWPAERVGEELRCRFVQRGTEGIYSMPKVEAKAEIEARLTAYSRELLGSWTG